MFVESMPVVTMARPRPAPSFFLKPRRILCMYKSYNIMPYRAMYYHTYQPRLAALPGETPLRKAGAAIWNMAVGYPFPLGWATGKLGKIEG